MYAREPHSINGSFIKPHRGAIVASLIDYHFGTIIFELSLKECSDGIDVHGEFYAAGGLFIICAMDLKQKSGFGGRIPRELGYKLLSDFLHEMKSYSGRNIVY